MIKLHQAHNITPKYATKGSAAFDLYYTGTEPLTLQPLKRTLLPTGLYIAEMPYDVELQLRPRSGLALNHAITIINTPATIDADYRGEIKIALINLGDKPYTFDPLERIAQGAFNKVIKEFTLVTYQEVLDNTTDRGAGGFGHTGKK